MLVLQRKDLTGPRTEYYFREILTVPWKWLSKRDSCSPGRMYLESAPLTQVGFTSKPHSGIV